MTTPVRVGASYDGPRLTVHQLMKPATRIRNLVINMVKDNLLADEMLRQGPPASSGAVRYEEVTPLYADWDAEIVAEFGEFPGTETPATVEYTKITTKRGIHLKVSQEMIDRNNVDRVRTEMRMVRDKLVNHWDAVFFNAVMNHPSALTINASNQASGGWYADTATAGIRKDIATAVYNIQSQGASGAQLNEKFGYEPDTLIIHPQTVSEFMDSEEVNKVFAGSPLADEQLRYKGVMPRKFFGLNVMKSWQCPANYAIVCQRKTMGFISDEKPLQGDPLYEDKNTQTWRTNFYRTSLVAIDNPKAVCIIDGINGTLLTP